MLALHAPALEAPVIKAQSAKAPSPASATPNSAKAVRYGAHFGSFGTPQGAERAWPIFGKKYKILRKTDEFAVVPVDLGAPKGVLYRLIAGPTPSKDDARRLCDALKEAGSYCSVVRLDS